MIKLAKLTDYAVVIMAEMSRNKTTENMRSAAWLSERTGVPEPTVAKILKILTRQNLIQSQRGASGGYHLTVSPDEISILDIIVAMEGPVAITSCVDGHPIDCVAEEKCQLRGNWDKVNTALREALAGVSLREIAVPAPCHKTVEFSYEPISSEVTTEK